MNNQILQDVKDRLNIVDIIGGYIQLKKAGVNYKAPCPFHNEKSPSLVVSPQKQIWHCFGCGEGGDVFGFVMRYESLEFRDALKLLADKAGVKLPEFRPESKEQVDEREQLLRINDFAARFYHEVLLKDKRAEGARAYLKKRGLTEKTIEQWKIGYAPDDFHALENVLLKKNVAINDLIKAGVSAKNERGQIYDRFRNRITFPIYNYFSECVGFTARILNDDGKSAKYVNSPETLIYNKSRTLFGLNFAKESIRKKDEMVIVEGQMDCISLHQSGFENVVASSGTAYNESATDFTSARRLSTNVKLCFDSDSAGQIALRRTGEMLLKQGFKVWVITLKGAKDPDELVKKSPGLWNKAAHEAERFLDYFINLAEIKHSNDAVAQLNFISDEVIPLLAYIRDPLEQGHYVQKIMKQYLVSEKDVREKLRSIKEPQKKVVPTQSPVVAGSTLLEKLVLGGMLKFPEFKARVKQFGSPSDFSNNEARSLAECIMNDAKNDDFDTLAKESVFMVESALDESAGGQDALQRELNKAFAMLRKNTIRQQQKDLSVRIKEAERLKQKQTIMELNQQFAALGKLLIEFDKLL